MEKTKFICWKNIEFITLKSCGASQNSIEIGDRCENGYIPRWNEIAIHGYLELAVNPIVITISTNKNDGKVGSTFRIELKIYGWSYQ